MHLPPLCRPCDFDISIELPEPSSYRVTGWRPCGHVCNFSRVGQPFNLYNYQRRSAKGVSWAYDKLLSVETWHSLGGLDKALLAQTQTRTHTRTISERVQNHHTHTHTHIRAWPLRIHWSAGSSLLRPAAACCQNQMSNWLLPTPL